ncbi:hypothetical protein P170DRAFT_481241 [Aspergillus steynii IBT 23096]|uniref:Uncharacterized protein n=1 Tax=Aspergillus steynii IBT 23096 TaxID=1392250 RepID=A0A2I2FRM9_9EURO|nr:uncharacterized protein P170DRAFT_481241 [Aspergillus steynii IBT 23096]PLB43292.1 hypothetical protein P170DRAFT_481241 [Aspergillus steynii IBT 23096]
MPSTAEIHVAIHHNEGVYKHWTLYINGPTDAEQVVLHIMGFSMNFRFEDRNSDARKEMTLMELIHMCDVPASKISTIRRLAEKMPIHNEYSGYNCQDYVLELLDELEAKGIIDGADEAYKVKKENVKNKQEGLI